MVTLTAIIPALEQEDWFSVLDLQRRLLPYLDMTIAQEIPTVYLGQNHYQDRVLPFGLSSTPGYSPGFSPS